MAISTRTTPDYVFETTREARGLALRPDDAVFDRFSAAAGAVIVVVGFAEACERAGVCNSAALLDATGVRVVYRQVHLWDREKHFFTPGDARPPVVETPFGRVAVMICFDMEFPEWTRVAALAGADLLAVPINWPLGPTPEGERPAEVQIAIASARMNKMAIACADRVGVERGVDWTAGTSIVSSLGAVVSQVGPGKGTAWADLDLLDSRDKKPTGGRSCTGR